MQKQIRFGLIGTSWISKKFWEATQLTKGAQTTAIYSRTIEHGKRFLNQLSEHLDIYTDLSEMLASSEIDAVYIASPNRYHFEQIMASLASGKHVLVEKPAVVSVEQMQIINQFLKEHPNVYFMEAIKNIFQPAFQEAQTLIPQLGTLDGASLVYLTAEDIKQLTETNLPSVLSLKANRGVLYDLGIYLISSAIEWFGTPEDSEYQAKMVDLPDGADYFGRGRLKYQGFEVEFLVGNRTNSKQVSEIYGSNATLVLNHATHLDQLTILKSDGEKNIIIPTKLENTMTPEIEYFTKMILNQDKSALNQVLKLTNTSTKILEQMRKSAGINW